MSGVLNVSRRGFLKGLALSGLVLGVRVTGFRPFGDAEAAESGAAFAPNVYLAIAADGSVTILAHRSEMGTGIRTTLPMVLADELGADWSRVHVEQADGDARYGDQNTDGSRSIRQFYSAMREAGAAARLMLVGAAAQRWGVPVDQCHAQDHAVVHTASGRRLGYGELAVAAAALPVPASDQLPLKPARELRYIGRGMPSVDLDDIVQGKARYGIDQRLPGMKYAVVARCPVYGGSVKSFDDRAALAVPGVERVLQLKATPPPSGFRPLGGIAVVATSSWAAMRGREALHIEWDLGPNADHDSDAYRTELEATARRPGTVCRKQGDVDAALKGAARKVEADYFVPYLAQAMMEPPSATAHFADGRCAIWAPTQAPQQARTTVAQALGLDESAVTVHVTLLGGAFGRKSKPDFVAEAALVSRAVGAPVNLLWSREDDIRHGYYHAISAQHLEAGLDADGRAVAWLHRTVFPPIGSTFDGSDRASAGELSQGVVDMPFAIDHVRCESGAARAHVRIGWYRSVFNIPHAFAVCSFADELAAVAGRDPLEYLRELLGPPRQIDLKAMGVNYRNYGEPLERYPIDTGRMRAVLDRVAAEAGWGGHLGPRQGRGIALHRSFASTVAAVVQVEVDASGRVHVPRVDIAADCGQVINPDRVRAQFEGAVIMGLSNALYSRISARRGRIEQRNYSDYAIARIDIAPETRVHLIDSEAPPGGVGEPGVPPVAPALANAIFAATGTRVRALPVDQAALRADGPAMSTQG